MPDPELDLATHIGDNVVAATLGINTFQGEYRPISTYIPAKAVFVKVSGGPQPQAYNGETTQLKQVQVDVRVRGDKDDQYSGGKTWAESIHAACKYASISGYIDVRNLQPEPIPIGRDGNDHYEWAFSVLMIFEE